MRLLLIALFVTELTVSRGEYDSFRPYLRIHPKNYQGIGFASYNTPVMSFGGYNGQMSLVGYGPPDGLHAIAKRDTEQEMPPAMDEVHSRVFSLMYRNDTMCLGLAVCQECQRSSESKKHLEQAFQTTSKLQGVNFLQYAVKQSESEFEKCEDAFTPCAGISLPLLQALRDVLAIVWEN